MLHLCNAQFPAAAPETVKEYLAKEAAKEAIIGLGALAIGAACEEGVITTPLCVPIAEMGADELVAAACAVKYVLDPPDPNYMAIATPTIPPITPLLAQGGISQNLADATNRLLTKSAERAAVSVALVTTINRASGALAANDRSWLQIQMIVAGSLKTELEADMVKQADLLLAFQSALAQSGMEVTISSDEVEAFESDVSSGGLPLDQVEALQRFGSTPDVIDAATSLIYVQDAAQAATFPSTLTDPELLDLLKNGSVVLLPSRRRAVSH